MGYDADVHHRRSVRLQAYDYGSFGAYFVTIGTYGRECIFDEGCLRAIVEAVWQGIPGHFPHVRIDEFVVMPNHAHGIVWIVREPPPVGARHASPLPPAVANRPNGAPTGSLGAIIGSFKSATTKRINEMRQTPGAPVWQRSYYERIIRTDRELHDIRQYITANPAKWADDPNHPTNAVR